MVLIDARFQESFTRLGLNSGGSITRFFGGQVRDFNGKGVVVKPSNLPLSGEAAPVYFKQYRYRPPSWKFIGRPSKARCEYRNYQALQALGVPTAEALACGEERDPLGRLCSAFIITRSIECALPLHEFVKQNCPDRRSAHSRNLRATLLRELAGLTRRIHQADFYHHDLAWRNVLVTWQPAAEPRLWWIDCPRGQFDRWSPWRRRRLLKDLASLDKLASQYCSHGERLRFMSLYLGKSRLDAKARRLIRDVLAYRKRRWPEDWNER